MQHCNFCTYPAHSKLATTSRTAGGGGAVGIGTWRAAIAVGRINTGKTRKLVKWKN